MLGSIECVWKPAERLPIELEVSQPSQGPQLIVTCGSQGLEARDVRKDVVWQVSDVEVEGLRGEGSQVIEIDVGKCLREIKPRKLGADWVEVVVKLSSRRWLVNSFGLKLISGLLV